jgi:hypothetical protein
MLADAHSSHICPSVCSMFLSRDREGSGLLYLQHVSESRPSGSGLTGPFSAACRSAAGLDVPYRPPTAGSASFRVLVNRGGADVHVCAGPPGLAKARPGGRAQVWRPAPPEATVYTSSETGLGFDKSQCKQSEN